MEALVLSGSRAVRSDTLVPRLCWKRVGRGGTQPICSRQRGDPSSWGASFLASQRTRDGLTAPHLCNLHATRHLHDFLECRYAEPDPGANRLYERAGMSVTDRYHTYEKRMHVESSA